MFEKEAEERGNEKIKGDFALARCSRKAYKDGFVEGAEFGYNKANEWHYVKNGDLPIDKTEKKYLVALKSEYGGFFYETDIWCETLHCFASNNPTKVYAWKEIVLPKESE